MILHRCIFSMNEKTNSEKRSRLPPGQHLTEKFPVLQKGGVQHIEGVVENPQTFSLDQLEKIKDQQIECDIHCVTSWSKFNTKWKGISFQELFKIVKPTEKANFIEFHCADGGFTTTVPIDKLKSKENILALRYEGLPLGDKHGGPVRAVIPDLYFYKSAKWVTKITFLNEDRLGYWERGGYSNKADPWKEQRYRRQDS